ncbi:hypothetical protein SPAN111604_15025 [Sphingomonas antarctica]|uniref:relaxase/mobilization nuclease domain-containing protein n=1 Tax=Sphingomonas antarctica TaxID=2040274 RepID=UPI0039E9750C
MIIKLIDKKEGAKGADRYARGLAAYMADADPRRLRPDAIGLDHGLTLSSYMGRMGEIERGRNEPPRERVLYRSALVKGEGLEWDEGVAEMERRLRARKRRVKKPVRHAVLSYRAGEHPTEDQCHEAVGMLAEELGCEGAAVLWAAHADTGNVHIHALIVTVDAETGAALPFGQGADSRANYKEAMQRAIARIEHVQQLQSEAGGRYEVRDGHVVRRPAPAQQASPMQIRKRAQLRQEIIAFENQSGFKSFTRLAQEVAGPILDEARSWHDLHRNLATQGLGIRPTVNGGELYAGADRAKLSNIDRRHSWTQLIKADRLGRYLEPEDLKPAPYEPRILDHDKAAAWLKRQEREQAVSWRIDQRVASLLAARNVALAEMRAKITHHRDDLAAFGGDPRLRRDIAAAWPRIGADAIASLSAAFDVRIAAVRALRNAADGVDDLDMIDLDALGALDAGIAMPWHGGHGPPPVVAIEGFDAERRGNVVRYWTRNDSSRRRQPALVDAGAIIWVNDVSDRAVEAALTLAYARFGSAAVFGDAAYLAQCARAAERLNITTETITVAEARRRAHRKQPTRLAERQYALDRYARRQADTKSGRRAWVRAYKRAIPADDLTAASGGAARLSDVPHHSTIPTLQAQANETPSPAVLRRRAPSRESGIS